MLTLTKMRQHVGIETQPELDRIRRTPDWHLGYALGAVPSTSSHFCPDLHVLTAICSTLGHRNRTVRAATLKLSSFDAVIIGWLDADREVDAPCYTKTATFMAEINSLLDQHARAEEH